MKNYFRNILVVLLVAMFGLFLVSCGEQQEAQPAGDSLAGTYDIVVWTSEMDGVDTLTKQQIADFCALPENAGIIINPTVSGIGEGDAATQMITNVEDGADLYFFAQDQLSRLVQAAALNPLGVKAAEEVAKLNDADSVEASKVNGKLCCYPATSDNGYLMYYDKSVITDPTHLESLELLIKDCEDAGRMFSMDLSGSGWYNAAFFFATGCISKWETDDEGKFISVNDTFNSPEGIIALRGIQKLVKSSCYTSSASGADFDAAVKSAVVVTGTWDKQTVKNILKENFGVAPLPSFTVDGKTYHLGSFRGNKLVGVKPQMDAKKGAVLQRLALYLTGEKCQMERFNQFGWGPSNLAAQANDAVKADETLQALNAQFEYATLQGNIHGSWWDISKTYVAAAKEADFDDVAALQQALSAYDLAIQGLVK